MGRSKWVQDYNDSWFHCKHKDCPRTESILTQIDWFHSFVGDRECQGKDEAACKSELGNALFWIGQIGGNDYARLFASSIGLAIANKQFTEQAVNHICTLALISIDKLPFMSKA